jgi:glycosyltransferase involved in cell wall biosynthesis
MIFWKTKRIEVFCRHAFFSSISSHKKRFPKFSHELCYQNLKETFDFKAANLTFLFDAAKGPLAEHFLKNEKNVIQIQEGSEAGSFLRLLDHVSKLDLHPETILYFLEDDYLHRPGWLPLLEEGLEIAEYVTLYDHKDKYFLYPELSSRIFVGAKSHWRTTPSTTNTFALRFKTLLRDLSIHRQFSENRAISTDHEKFCQLHAQGIILISSMPGFSTHAEPEFASPCVDWEKYLTRS